MSDSSPKLIAVVAAAVLHWLLGAAWFSPMKQAWLAGIGKTNEQLMNSGMPAWLPHIITIAANLVMAYVLGWLILATGPQTLARGVTVGLCVWAGLVASAF